MPSCPHIHECQYCGRPIYHARCDGKEAMCKKCNERVEKIVLHLNLNPKATWVSKYLPDVAAEIRAAEAEGYERGKREAFEEAAKMIDDIERSKGQFDKHGYCEMLRARAREMK